MRAILVHNYNLSVLNTYKLFSLQFSGFISSTRVPRIPDSGFLRKNKKSLFATHLNVGLAQSLLMLRTTKSKRVKKESGSGSETAVARCFGGGTSHLSDGGSFGGTESPGPSKSKRQGLLMDGLTRLGGALQDLSAARKPIETDQQSLLLN